MTTPSRAEKIIESFNSFIEKWVPQHYPHLIDSDENDGEQMRQEIIEALTKRDKRIEDLETELRVLNMEKKIADLETELRELRNGQNGRG